ncbi:MAG: glutamyl-tRNA reductase [Phycisphaerae bacterium]
MIPGLISIEISHKTAPLPLRERITVDAGTLPDRLRRLREICDACVILKTCGRLELYAIVSDTPDGWLDRYARLTGIPLQALKPFARGRQGTAAGNHLMRVAAGLESPLLGEDHILGQVRDAFLSATDAHTVGPILCALFRSAIHAGKRVRHETPISRVARSYADRAAELLEQSSSSMDNVLILGAGSLARDVASRLATRGRRRIHVLSRHLRRAASLAAEHGCQAHAFEDLPTLLADTDAIVACTSSTRHLIEAPMLDGHKRPLTIVDLGMPRNVDPGVALHADVSLSALDDFADRDRVHDKIIRAARSIIDQEMDRFLKWTRARRASPIIARLRSLADGLDPESARRVNRAVHQSIQRLREGTAA